MFLNDELRTWIVFIYNHIVLLQLEEEITHAYDDKKFEIANKISKITDMLQQIETEIGQEVVGKDSKIRESKMKIESLWSQTENLQKKVESLLEKDLMSRATTADQRYET